MVQAEELYRLLHKRPFEPFRVYLTDGRVFDVRFPEINMIGTSWIRIGILGPGDTSLDPIPDHSVKVPLPLISRLELLPSVPSPAST